MLDSIKRLPNCLMIMFQQSLITWQQRKPKRWKGSRQNFKNDVRHAFISIWFLDSRIRRLHTDKSHTTRLYDSWLDYPSHIQYLWISLHIKKLSSYVKEALPNPIWYSTKIQKFYDFFAAFIFFSQKKGILFAQQHFKT